ncbi:MAG: amidohydrolase family protein [Woeseiaceae bacterium]|nr:amidohydrolase family protein [Woeseiaceae bacterium]
MKSPVWILFALLGALAACSSESEQQLAAEGADLILTNGRVYTMRWEEPAPDGTLAEAAPKNGSWKPDADAVAIKGDEVVFVGETSEAMSLRGDATRVVDLAGATVLPGLVDSHTHVFGLGAAIERVDLTDVETEEEAIERVVERAKITPEGEWILGRGWDEGAWANRYPDKVLLTEAVPNHPVFLASLHGFAGWANQMALDRAGLTADTEVPVGGEMRLGPDGEPNGLFLNRAVPLIRDAVPEPSHEQMMQTALTGLKQMAEDGYVAVHDAGLDTAMMAALEQLEAEGKLPIRVFAMLSLRDEDLMRRWIERGPDADVDSMLVTHTVKAYYDGALGSRGARLLYDYSDQPGHRGISGSGYGFNEALMAEAMKAGFQVAIHAIGDAGNREALDIIERIYAEAPEARNLRHRIEHAQVIHPDDIPRFAELGLIASMEPPHAVEDKTWAEDRVGPERILGAYAWRSLREAGVDLTFNSDNPGSDHDIFYGLHAAITRQDKNSEPEGGWYPEQRVTVDEAVRGYTSWSAYASFTEDESGILDAGRWADITVMDVDPFVLAEQVPADMLQGRILMTIVGGDVVHENL